jgi:hypothetical protein
MSYPKTIAIISFLVIFLAYSPKVIFAGSGICGGQPGFSYAKDKGVIQGWLVPYHGDNQSFAGIPCKTREATQEEINQIISSCCDGANASECLDKATLADWANKYPTCKARNLEVKKNADGKLEAFDIQNKITATPTPTTKVIEISPTPTPVNKAVNNESFLSKLFRQILEFFSSLVTKFR